MGRVFSATAESQTLNTGSVLVAVQSAAGVAAGAILRLLRCEVTQSGSTTSAMVRLQFAKRDTAGTLTCTGATPQNLVLGGPASGIASGTSSLSAATIGFTSTADSGGSYTPHWSSAPNQLNGWLWVPTPAEQIIIPPSTVWVARFVAAPTNLAGWDTTLVFEEII